MLSAKRKSDGAIVNASFEKQSNGPFFCPVCGDPVILKVGTKRVSYFAHENPLACQYAKGESDAHRRCKLEIFESLQRTPHVQLAELERPLGTVRPDVSAYIHGVPVAIEVQISSLSVETIMRRTIEYHRKGIFVLWLLLWTPSLESQRYSPTLWEKWLHTCYFGRVYYWIGGLTVVSYHFEPSLKSVPKKSWYSRDGEQMSGGGYTTHSKRHRTAVRGRTFNLATDFGPRMREWWGSGDMKVPDAKLFMERNVSKDGVPKPR